jgi:DNA-binding transcriptional ArsR family regulator
MTTTVAEQADLMPPTPEGRGVLAKFFRALGDPTRLALLALICDAERTGTQCVEHLGIAQSRASAHLACLVNCGLVTARREGRSVYYGVRDPRVLELVRLGVELAADKAASVAACTRVDQRD